MKTVLVTGGAGFIGSNFVPYWVEKYPDYMIINLDKLTYAGNLANLKECEGAPNYRFVRGDICDAELAARLFKEHDIRGVVHFAAESHVDNSISGPRAFIETNLVGTFTLLDAARNHWMEGPHKAKPGYGDCRFHHISTDEVYGALGETGFFSETTPYDPSSPYSASKAGSDMLARAYHRTFGLNVTVSNCSNNYGPKQHPEKLIPKIVSNALAGKEIPIYGDGKNVRDWLYVLDHCKAIDLIFHRGRSGETYNVGGHNEKTNLEVVQLIIAALGKGEIKFVRDRAGHDRRYAIDPTKIHNELGWLPQTRFEDGIQKTIQWYLDNKSWWENIISGEYQKYYERMYGNR